MELLIVAFFFITAALGPYEAMVHRAMFLALVICLGFSQYPLGKDCPWRPFGLAVDLALDIVSVAARVYIVRNADRNLAELPWLVEISDSGEAIITKLAGTGGRVDRASCTEQLPYEDSQSCAVSSARRHRGLLECGF